MDGHRNHISFGWQRSRAHGCFQYQGQDILQCRDGDELAAVYTVRVLFFSTIHAEHLVIATDYAIGIPLGLALNFVGILKVIDWMAV